MLSERTDVRASATPRSAARRPAADRGRLENYLQVINHGGHGGLRRRDCGGDFGGSKMRDNWATPPWQNTPRRTLPKARRASSFSPRGRSPHQSDLAEFCSNSAIVSAPSADRNHHHRQHRGRCPKRNCSPARPTPVRSACDPSMTMPTNRQRRRHQAQYIDNHHSTPPCFHLTVPPAPRCQVRPLCVCHLPRHSAKATSQTAC